MKRFAFFTVLVILLAGGGMLTAMLASGDSSTVVPGVKIQTENVEASVFEAEGWQLQQLVLLVGFLLFNMIGIGVTIAIIMWFASRGIKQARVMEVRSSQEEKAAASTPQKSST